VADAGGNFGRFARTGLMDAYLESAKSQFLCGVAARHWLAFFKTFQEHTTIEAVERELHRLSRRLGETESVMDQFTLERLKTIVGEIEELVAYESKRGLHV
jgi:oligoendopeptidase F